MKFYDIEKYHNNYFFPIPGIPDEGFFLKPYKFYIMCVEYNFI